MSEACGSVTVTLATAALPALPTSIVQLTTSPTASAVSPGTVPSFTIDSAKACATGTRAGLVADHRCRVLQKPVAAAVAVNLCLGDSVRRRVVPGLPDLEQGV